jgi:hemoglobin
MQPLFWRRTVMAITCAAGLALAAPVLADTGKEPDGKTVIPKPPDSKALDHYLYTSLRTIINHGVELYNAGRVEECYDGFRQSLQDLDPVLSAHPDLQKTIKDALQKVENDPQWRVKMAAQATMPSPELAPVSRQKAFALRAVFNDVRTALAPEGAKKPAPSTTTLWDKLGGEKAVAKLVDDFTAAAASDPKVDFTRGGKYKLDDLAVADLKKKLVEFISSATGGPLKYTGKSMKEVHKGMGITNEEFDAIAADLKRALAKNGVKAADADALLTIVETTRKDIVEGKKKPEENPKPADTGTVQGKVTDNGKPLAKGTVTLVDKAGKKFTGAVAADGTYDVEKVPPGDYKVGIDGGPAKFADPDKSGLTLTVTKGKQTHDIELK